jgi:predicted nucleic acid-binding protein
MTSGGLKFKYLDASALVKLYIYKNEKGSQRLREFFYTGTNFFTTWLCLAEALGVLKSKWSGQQSKAIDTKIETEEYLNVMCSLLIEWRTRIEFDDIKSVDPSIPLKVRRIAEKYKLDYSDALQLWAIKNGINSHALVISEQNIIDSALFLITSDKGLATAAKSEGIKVWNCEDEPAPGWAY